MGLRPLVVAALLVTAGCAAVAPGQDATTTGTDPCEAVTVSFPQTPGPFAEVRADTVFLQYQTRTSKPLLFVVTLNDTVVGVHAAQHGSATAADGVPVRLERNFTRDRTLRATAYVNVGERSGLDAADRACAGAATDTATIPFSEANATTTPAVDAPPPPPPRSQRR